MKKILTLALAVMMLATFCTVFAVSADEPTLAENQLPVAGTDAPNVFEDGKIFYYPAGEEDRVVSSDDYNFRYAFVIVCDANGNLVEIGNNLLTTTEEASKGTEYQNDFTVPAGGFAISYFYNATDGASNQKLHDIYTSITGELEDASKALYNVTAKVETEVAYTLSCDGTVLTINEKSESEPESSEPEAESSEEAVESSEEAVESSEEAVESSEAPATSSEAPKTGDAGILVFAVLAVVAIAGCAVAVKVRG